MRVLVTGGTGFTGTTLVRRLLGAGHQVVALDYKDGLQGAGFAIENPNAQRSCGCGKSFS